MEKTITDERLIELSKTLKPVVRKTVINDSKLFYIEDINPRKTTITWDPKFTAEAIGLVEHSRVSFFSYSYPALWKPSIAEVLVEVQNDETIIKECVAFEVLHIGMEVIEGKGNYGTAIFYKLELPKEENINGTAECGITYKPYTPEHLIYLLVTYIERETLDVFKMALQVEKDSPLGKNYIHYMEDSVKKLIPTPNKDKEYRIADVEIINNMIVLGY